MKESVKSPSTKTIQVKTPVQPIFTLVFERKNYILMLVGIAFVLLGYFLMIGGGADDPNVFSEKLFDFQRLTLAPVLLLIGLVIEIFAIMYHPGKKSAE